MRDRLIELFKSAGEKFNDSNCTEEEALEILADHLIENGVIKLPVNAGDTIYRPFGRYVESWIVTTIVLHPEEIVFIDDSDNSFKESDIGVSTYLTREEAEKALKGGAE